MSLKTVALNHEEVAIINALLAELACRRLGRSADLSKDGGCTTEELLAIADVMPKVREQTRTLIEKLVDFEWGGEAVGRPKWRDR